MTVCIAAICENGNIFGASDRMMTSGDIEFEPKLDFIIKPILPAPVSLTFNANTKIYAVTTSIVVMTAGDSGLQSEIVQDVLFVINSKIQENKTHWLSIKEVADIYVEAYNRAKSRRAQQTIFAPFGLDQKKFIEQSNQISNQLLNEITKQIQRFESYFKEMHGVETIITGIDTSIGNPGENLPSAHIYSIVKSSSGDFVTCCDSVGFAAVGSGARHAESQFMMTGHSPYSSQPETLLLTYLAKKRSEVAPGVGKGTDMFAIGPALGSFAMLQNIPDFDMKKINEIYESVETGQSEVFQKGMAETKDYIAKMFKARLDKQLKDEEERENQLRQTAAINNPVSVMAKTPDKPTEPTENKVG